MKLPRPLSLYWFLLSALLGWALILHGQQFGGVKWLVHVGRGWSALLQSALILFALLLALSLRSKSSSRQALSLTVVVLSSVFLLSLFGGFIPFIGALLTFLSPYAYSRMGLGIHVVVFASAIVTYVSRRAEPSAA